MLHLKQGQQFALVNSEEAALAFLVLFRCLIIRYTRLESVLFNSLKQYFLKTFESREPRGAE